MPSAERGLFLPRHSVRAEWVEWNVPNSESRMSRCVPNESVCAEWVGVCRIIRYVYRKLCRPGADSLPTIRFGAERILFSSLSRKCHFEIFNGFSTFWNFRVPLSHLDGSFSSSVPVDGEFTYIDPLQRKLSLSALMVIFSAARRRKLSLWLEVCDTGWHKARTEYECDRREGWVPVCISGHMGHLGPNFRSFRSYFGTFRTKCWTFWLENWTQF